MACLIVPGTTNNVSTWCCSLHEVRLQARAEDCYGPLHNDTPLFVRKSARSWQFRRIQLLATCKHRRYYTCLLRCLPILKEKLSRVIRNGITMLAPATPVS